MICKSFQTWKKHILFLNNVDGNNVNVKQRSNYTQAVENTPSVDFWKNI